MRHAKHWAGWSEAKLKGLLAKGSIRGYTISQAREEEEPKESKFHNEVCYYNGIRFDSIKERRRYIDLEFAEQQGLITDLERQVPYELNEDGQFSYKYVADFRYRDAPTGQLVIEDTKGLRTREYRKKRKLMLKIYGIRIKET